METKVIFSPQLAQHLLHSGYRIVELKPKRGSPQDTVFVFEVKGNFVSCVNKWVKEVREHGGKTNW